MDKILTEEDAKIQRATLKDSLILWGIKVFGTHQSYNDWLVTPAKEFGGSRPASLHESVERMELLLLVIKQKYHSRNNPK